MQITEHPIFGDSVRTVAICSARRTKTQIITPIPNGLNNQDLSLNAYIKTRRFARRMERVFNSIRSHHGSVTISIYDNPGREDFGMNLPFEFLNPMSMRCCGWTQLTKSFSKSITYRTAETLEETVYAARRARCPIRRLKINLFAGTSHNQLMRRELDEAMRRVLESSRMPLSIDLGGVAVQNTPQMSYVYDHKSLKLLSIDDGDFDERSTAYFGLRASHQWLLTQKVTQLSMINVSHFRSSTFLPLSLHLTRLKIQRVSVYTEHFDHNLWSTVVETLSEIPDLQYCELGHLTYHIGLDWVGDDEDGDFANFLVLLGHGEYLWTCGQPYFNLLLPGGCATIEMDGDDIQGKLRDLASYMRAAEHRKRQQIISEGAIKDNIVGFKHEVGQ